MALTTHEFSASLANGESAEAILDAFFARHYDIKPASLEHQRLGIDRYFTRHRDGKKFSVEYKTDSMAQHTKRAFIEVVSNDWSGKPGWIYTTTADFLILFIPHMETAYIMDPAVLEETVHKVWMRQFPLKVAANEHYNSIGVVVPLPVLAAHPAVKTLSIPLTEQQRTRLAWAS